ncbi:hypothetical protein CQY20_31695 [Mycolicibacterium agri]|uniref:Uncharacterized protein n=1 Tax=Mycolicibacterium agri TaxID=36811 RepID=A0A2A7MNX9_MYCAG|nr:hypothetical protein CQY20_31695 [Mycolicibacterium agri]
MWAEYFRRICEQSPAIEWFGAGFARCEPDDVTGACDRLRAATAAADAAFIAHLRMISAEKASDIVGVEQQSEASYPVDGPFLLPCGPPQHIY